MADEDPGGGGFRGNARFQLVTRLGAGGMGVVYEARDRERDARVALKTLPRLSGESLLRFKQEFRALEEIDHPNLVGMRELHEADGRWFFTMDLVEGTDFLSWVRPGGQPLEEAPTAEISHGRRPGRRMLTPTPMPSVLPPGFDETRLRAALAQLASALAALHAAGLAHRDVKPSNIRVAPDGRLVLLDFGLVAEAEAPAGFAGTADYLAPERAAGQRAGTPGDCYAVGVLLHVALTGRLPRQRAPSPSALVEGVPRDLEALCVDLLRDDPAERPNAAEVLQRLGGPSAPHAPASVFVGRAAELEVLRAARARTQQGRAIAVLVQGESGVGKSALVRRFVDALAGRALVLAGRCHQRESVPYKAFDGVIDALSRHLAALPAGEAARLLPRRAGLLARAFPVLARVVRVDDTPAPDVHEQRARVFAALRELLTRLTERHSVVIVIDDLQWADGDSRALLGELMRGPDAPPLLFLGTRRSDVGGELALPCETRRLPLGALAMREASELAALLLGGRLSISPSALAKEAGGHPLFLAELCRHLTGGGPPARGELRLDEVLEARVATLDREARRVLELVAVAGVPLPKQVAALAADMSVGELERVAAQLRVGHLLRSGGGDTLEPYHDRVTAAVLFHLDWEARKACHRLLALALEALPDADPEALALHWDGAGNSARAAPYARTAGQRASSALAFDRAARLYTQALEGAPSAPPGELDVELGDALANAGRGPEAASCYLRAVPGAPAERAIELLRRAADQYLRSGHLDDGMVVLGEVLRSAGFALARTPGRALASLLLRRTQVRLRGLGFRERAAAEVAPGDLARLDACWTVATGLAMIDTIRGADFQARHLLLALRAGEPLRLCQSLAAESVFQMVGDARKQRRTGQLLAHAAALAERMQDPRGRGFLEWARMVIAYLGGRWREALAESTRAEETLSERCAGVAWELYNARFYGLLARLWLGDLRGFCELVPRMRQAAEERGDFYAAFTLRLGLLSLSALADDDPTAACGEIEGVMARLPQGQFQLQQYWETVALALIALYQGEASRALRLIDQRWAPIQKAMILRVQYLRVEALGLRARLALAAGGADNVARAERDARRLGGERMAWADPQAELVLAAVAHARGRGDDALARLHAAERGFLAADMLLHAWVARRRRGELTGGDAGRALVEAADGWLGEQGVKNPTRFCEVFAPGFHTE